MTQTDLQTSLQHIRQKLKLLLDKHSALQKENKILRAEKENLQGQLTGNEELIKQLQQQTDVLKSGIQSWHPEQKKLFVKRIDLYLKEIEKCLALMNE